VAVAAVYFAAARLSLLLAFEKTNASPAWPPSGIAFAAVLLLGSRVWPGILLGAFFANLVVFLANQAAGFSTIVTVSASIAVGNTLEALSGGALFRRFVGSDSPFGRARDLFKFVAVALLMCLTSASIGPTALSLAGMAPWGRYETIWFTWWLGETAGVLVVTPLLLAWSREPQIRWDPRRSVEAALLFALVFVAGRVGFGGWLPAQGAHYPLAFVAIPFLVWAAFRFGPREAATAVLLVSGIAIWDTLRGVGPFVRETINESLLLLQFFVSVVTLTTLVMTALVAERRAAATALRRAHDELEVRVRERTAQLEATNRELQAFTYTVSHDLKAPLRGMEGLAQALQEDYAAQLDAKGRHYLGMIRTSARRMGGLIDDLLRYARLERRAMRREQVLLRPLVQRVCEELEGGIRVRGLTVLQELAVEAVEAEQEGLREALANLLGNAVKFSREAGGTITIESRRDGDSVILSVADIGIGFDMKNHDRIFRIFERLHRSEEYPGTGVGLAIVRKVAERHGGRAWAVSEPGKGSTFFLALPTNAGAAA
jgi:signal transduction histidine kinase